MLVQKMVPMTKDVDALFTRSFIFVMAITCGVCAGANYYNQPLIYAIAASLSVTVEQAAATIVLNQFAYALGLIVLIPLGDKFSKRKLVIGLMVTSAIAQIAIGFSTQLWALYIFTFLATLFSVASQVLIPFISSLGSVEKMSQIIGTLMSGLFLGILLARAYAGFISTFADWHTVYLTSGGLLLVLAFIMYLKLPVSEHNPSIRLGSIYQSMWKIAGESPQLLRRGLVGALSFGSVILALSTMAFVLANPPYHFSELEIGLFGLVGAAGVFATRWAGQRISLKQENLVAYIASFSLILQWLLLCFAQYSLIAYIVGLLCGYFGISVMHVLNQSLILRNAGQQRSRKHSLYMFMYFLGAAFGSMAGLYAWSEWGWYGCCALGLTFAVLMLVVDRVDHHFNLKKIVQ